MNYNTKGEQGFNTQNPGRPKGAVNKTTRDLRELISDFLNENFGAVKLNFEKLKPNEKARFFVDLLSYAVPKMNSVQMNSYPN